MLEEVARMNEMLAPHAAPATRVLVVDDDPGILGFLRLMLGRAGYDVVIAESGREAMRKFAAYHPVAVVTDLHMPEADGFDLIADIHRLAPSVPIVVVTGEGRLGEPMGYDVTSLGACEVLRKPFRSKELIAVLQRVLDAH